jgi:hypothetical protein
MSKYLSSSFRRFGTSSRIASVAPDAGHPLNRFLPLLIAATLLAGCSPVGGGAATVSAGDRVVADAFASHQSGVAVVGKGEVDRVLPDDNNGDRHQRFILRMDSGKTLLIAHNIDIAPRIPALKVGDVVEFNGQYEWNEQGGTVHWTHHDPSGKHQAGWLRCNGQVYQ